VQIVNAVRAEGPVKKDPHHQFSTLPYHLWCCDGEVYIVKFKQNPEGYLALVNEYVCYKLAKLLELPIAEAALINVDHAFVEVYGEEISQFIGEPLQPGVHYGSKKIMKASPVSSHRLIQSSSNSHLVPNILLFDQWIGNCDRDANKGNMLFDMLKKEIVIIDHSHVFELGVLWGLYKGSIQLNRLIGSPFKVYEHQGCIFSKLAHIVKGNNPFSDIISKMGRITNEQLWNIIDEVPLEWGLTYDEKKTLHNFLCERLGRITDALPVLSSVLPYWKGGVPV